MTVGKPAVGKNIDQKEIAKFDSLADYWWDRQGVLKSLHDINPLRLQYIDCRTSLCEKRVLDVGCGGGILSEVMAAKGARVTGIDAAKGPLRTARRHAEKEGRAIQYIQSTAEIFAKERPDSFDVITCLELLEHVDEPASIVAACARLVRPGGDVIFATIDKTPIAGILAILGGEYVLRLLARGTHQYSRFIKPRDLKRWATFAGLRICDLTWMHYNPFSKRYRLGKRGIINYLIHFKKGVIRP
ncbi:MAG: bifunctional 2-polyprenyl-6-hydroxyphenol methylase/3-demethylubiquinol 3-O-methyltransferase UbiG [Pseudomonadota bacterium]